MEKYSDKFSHLKRTLDLKNEEHMTICTWELIKNIMY